MADGDLDYSLIVLRSAYPNIPMKVIQKVIDTCKGDKERCKQLLEIEKMKYPAVDVKETGPSGNNEMKSVSARIKELQVSHEPSSTKPSVPERHVSTFERSVVNIARTPEPKAAPVITKSVSYSGPSSQFSLSDGSHLPSGGQSAPTDFTPFFQGIQNPTSIPNITCKTFNSSSPHSATTPQRPNAGPSDSGNKCFSAAGSPAEQRRPVKVINIPAGSLSGGSVSPAGTPLNSRHFRMHFGDTGGTCTVQKNPATIQRYASTPNVSQHYRSEYRTEATVPPQSIHSASIVVSTSPLSSQSTMSRKMSGEATVEVSRSANPFHFATGNGAEYQPSPAAYVREDGHPLSTPVQASSPGISHSRPDFNVDYSLPNRGYSEVVFPVAGPNYGYMTHTGLNYNPPISSDYAVSASYSVQPSHEQNYTSHYTQSKENHQGYHSPPTNATSSYHPTSPPRFNSPAAIGYPVQQMGTAQPPPPHQYGRYPSLNITGLGHNSPLAKSPNPVLTSHPPRLTSRTSSSESEHQDGVNSRAKNHYPLPPPMGSSRVSSQSSVGSDSSLRGNIQEETESDYIIALLQHQRNCLQKLKENRDSSRHQLLELRKEVNQLERGGARDNNIHRSFPSPSDITKLCEKNRELQTDIQLFVNEIEMYKSGHTPLNSINAHDQQNFYANMPTGQHDCNFMESHTDGARSSTSPSRSPPPRPPPPIPLRQRSTEPPVATPGTSDLFSRVPPVPPLQPTVNSGDSEEGEQWSCSACTFQNHPALKKCEMCELERFPEPKPPTRGGGGVVAINQQHPAASPPPPPSSLPHRPAATTTAEWVGGLPHHRSAHHQPPPHQHHRAGT